MNNTRKVSFDYINDLALRYFKGDYSLRNDLYTVLFECANKKVEITASGDGYSQDTETEYDFNEDGEKKKSYDKTQGGLVVYPVFVKKGMSPIPIMYDDYIDIINRLLGFVVSNDDDTATLLTPYDYTKSKFTTYFISTLYYNKWVPELYYSSLINKTVAGKFRRFLYRYYKDNSLSKFPTVAEIATGMKISVKTAICLANCRDSFSLDQQLDSGEDGESCSLYEVIPDNSSDDNWEEQDAIYSKMAQLTNEWEKSYKSKKYIRTIYSWIIINNIKDKSLKDTLISSTVLLIINALDCDFCRTMLTIGVVFPESFLEIYDSKYSQYALNNELTKIQNKYCLLNEKAISLYCNLPATTAHNNIANFYKACAKTLNNQTDA